jgi:hypothetical protein
MQNKLLRSNSEIFVGLDILVINAGTAIPMAFEDATLEELDRVIDIIPEIIVVQVHLACRAGHFPP